MALTATWQSTDLADFVPAPIAALAEIVPSIKTFVQAAGEVRKAAVQQLTNPTFPVPNPIYDLLEQALDQLHTVQQDLLSNSISVLPIPPQVSGLVGLQTMVTANLRNRLDFNCPIIPSDGYVAGILLIASGQDLTEANRLFGVLNNAFITVEAVKRTAGLEALVKSTIYQGATLLNRLAATAAPVIPSPWVTVRLGDFIPGSSDVLAQLDGLLTSMAAGKPVPQVSAFTDMIDRQIASINVIIDQIDVILTQVTTAFPAMSIKLMKYEPQQGGTDEVADSVVSWFDKTVFPSLSDITNAMLLSGTFVLFGSTTQAPVEALFGLLDSLILP